MKDVKFIGGMLITWEIFLPELSLVVYRHAMEHKPCRVSIGTLANLLQSKRRVIEADHKLGESLSEVKGSIVLTKLVE